MGVLPRRLLLLAVVVASPIRASGADAAGPFDLSQLSAPQRAAIVDRMSECDFPFHRFMDVPVIVEVTEGFTQRAVPPSNTPAEIWIGDQYDVGAVFMLEAAHIVDFRLTYGTVGPLTDFGPGSSAHQERLSRIMHGGRVPDHAWWHEDAYLDRPGEAWMNLFVRTYCPGRHPVGPYWTHRPTKEMEAKVRRYMRNVRLDPR